jgi:hypothetical protein
VTVASGPDLTDWLVALLRGLHPLRWLLCLVGLILTGLSAVVAQALFGWGPLDLPGWWQQPIAHVKTLGVEIGGGSLGRTILRGGLLLALNTSLWCLIGGWIARHELVARRRESSDIVEERVEPSATALLRGWWKSLLMCCPSALFFALVLLLPMVVAGWINTWFGSPGALVVSLLLPVVLVADLALMLVALGAVGWPLMPIAVAAECGDQFDALSRGYSYIFQRPVHFLLLTAIALGLAGLPLGVLYAFADWMTTWQPEARHTVFLLAAAFSASIFWSLQTLVYLHLRLAIDGVDASEVAVGPLRERGKTPSPDGQAAEVPATCDSGRAGGRSLVRSTILQLAAVIGSWCVTFWLFTRASSGPTEWLGWGLSETIVPPAEGVYRVASVIAGLWGVVWLALPLVRAARRLRSGRAPQDKKAHESN